VNNYIRRGALYEVNISHDMAQAVQLRLDGSDDVARDLFDDARRDIALLMERGSLFRFLNSTRGRSMLSAKAAAVVAPAGP